MKKFVLGFILGALLFSIIPASAAIQEYVLQKSDVRIMVDGEEHADKELPVLNYKGYNYLPAAAFRGICDKIGVGFNWDNAKKEIQITAVTQAKEGDNVSDVPLNKYGLPDFRDYEGEKPAIERDGRYSYFTYNGVRYIRAENYLESFKENPFPKNFRFERIVENGKFTDRIEFQKAQGEMWDIITLIEEVPYAYLDAFYLVNDYFINTILPLTQDDN